jgi:hypothetical protein
MMVEMPDLSWFLRAATSLALAGMLLLPGSPAAVAADPATATQPAAGRPHLDLRGDVQADRSARGGIQAWKVRTLYYYETIPSKWDWSLSTAVAKWNATGGGLKLVRTPYRSQARLTISYGSTGGAAGMATVGATPGAWVHLNSSYSSVDSLDAWNRVAVMAVFAHEIGHVLGFQHSSTTCSLMKAVMDITGCNMAPASLPGYYKCATVEPALVRGFVRVYGGTARYPSTTWCLLDPLPSALSGVSFGGGESSPVTIRWSRPTSLPSGSRVEVHVWQAASCTSPPAWAEYARVSPTALLWQDDAAAAGGAHCFRLRLVNRYGTGRTPVVRSWMRWVAPPTETYVGASA